MKPRILKKLIKRGVSFVRVLTEDAALARLDWEDLGGCTCFSTAPCGSCVHEGNPLSQEENPECWQMVPADTV